MPCLTDSQISVIQSIIDNTYNFLEQHVDVNSGASRFGELNAFFQNDLIGGFIPCGKVLADQDSIGVGLIRLQELESAKQILLAATPETPAPPPESTGDRCQDLINAINSIDVGSSVDWTEISPYIQIELNKFAPTLTNSLNVVVSDQVSTIIDYNTDILASINNIRSEINSTSLAVEEVYALLSTKTVEILERIHDTRIELKQTAERVIQIWNCLHETDSTVDNPICKSLSVDIEQLTVSLLEGLSVFLNPLFLIEPSLREHITSKISNLSSELIQVIGSCCDLIIQKIDSEIDLLSAITNNPTWLASISNQISALLTEIGSSQSSLLNQINSLHTRLTSILSAISSLSQVTEEGDVVNYVYHNTTNYYIDNNATTEPTSIDVSTILSAINSVQGVVEEISRCVCIEFTGVAALSNCNTDNPPKTFSYNGKGLKGISSQLASTATVIDEVGKRNCDSSNVAVVLPSDKYGELNCNRQITIYFGLKYPYFSKSTWHISLPQPRTDLSWDDFSDWIWEKGKFVHTVRFSTDGGQTYPRSNSTWGAFKTREHGIQFFDRALKLLDPSLQVLRGNNDGRMTKRNPTAAIKCVRAIVVEIDNLTGDIVETRCYAPPLD